MAECIKAAGLKTFLIAKTGTPDPTYKTHFYGGPLQADKQCCVITIAQYTKDFIVENMGVPADNITNVYNGTDTAKFKRTPEMADEVQRAASLGRRDDEPRNLMRLRTEIQCDHTPRSW